MCVCVCVCVCVYMHIYIYIFNPRFHPRQPVTKNDADVQSPHTRETSSRLPQVSDLYIF